MQHDHTYIYMTQLFVTFFLFFIHRRIWSVDLVAPEKGSPQNCLRLNLLNSFSTLNYLFIFLLAAVQSVMICTGAFLRFHSLVLW